jgi:hypothetical protein
MFRLDINFLCHVLKGEDEENVQRTRGQAHRTTEQDPQSSGSLSASLIRIWIQTDPDPAFRFNAYPDPPFASMRIRIQRFASMRIRIQLFFKVKGICDHWSIDPPLF